MWYVFDLHTNIPSHNANVNPENFILFTLNL